MHGRRECVSVLISAGAKIDAMETIHGTPLHAACENNQYESAKLLLLNGANPSARIRHKTPLHCSALNDHSQLVELLLKFGADVFYRDAKEFRPSELCKPNSDSYRILKFYEDNPQSLLQQCRLKIKVLLSDGRRYFKGAIQSLPKSLQSYLNFNEFR
ncbi:ankyrin repeat and SOCS box protein 13-like [Anneissia japonica]|uniref:ankyrin repeat and SOCS box protein 13-like n=1 Tax=Anneissia japonica TaxID=1529436 RepID=UPI0014254F95|nr:ankyrin repeat and SOCS box protein 13-like [Anneissia japonica]